MKLNDFREWLKSIVPDDVDIFIGDYLDTGKTLISVKQSTFVRPPFTRYNRYRITILSNNDRYGGNDYSVEDDPMNQFRPKAVAVVDESGTWEDVEAIAEAIEQATNSDTPCSGNVQLVAGKQGPFYTSEGRIYFTLEVQSII